MTNNTPKTDANLLLLDCDDSCLDIYVKTKDGKDFYGDIVSADISRELEEENNELLNFIKSLNATTHKHASYYRSECGRFLQKYDPRTKTH